MPTPFVPLQAIQSWYDDSPGIISVRLFLLDATVTTLLDSYDTVSDLPGRLATTGSYNHDNGINAGNWPLYYDSAAGVLELSLPSATWISTSTYTLTFRWIVISLISGYILTTIDLGSAQSITSNKMSLYTTQSATIPNSYPVFRWAKA